MSLAIHSSPASLPKPPLYLTARYNQLSHIHPKVGAAGAAASNAFLYERNGKRYVITSAHTLFSEPMAPSQTNDLQGATPPSLVKVGKTELGPMAYSRFFDVAIFEAKGLDIPGTPYTQTHPAGDNCVAHFEDPSADVIFTHTANATVNINRRTTCGAFFYKLIDGSSGSAISKAGKLVGMVSGCDQGYDNLTVFVPADTINHLIDRLPNTWNQTKNLDAFSIFPNMLTAPIPKALKAEFPGTLSHVVMYAKEGVLDNDNNQVLPLTMIDGFVANTALATAGGEMDVRIHPMKKEEAARRWFRFPREVLAKNKNADASGFLLPFSIDATKTDFASDMLEKVVWDGMNVTIDAQQKNKSEWKNKTATVYPISSVYYEYVNAKAPSANNDPDPYDISLQNSDTAATIGSDSYSLGTLPGILYKELTLRCLVRHWAFLVMSAVTSIQDAGNQFIVFAKECNRLKATLNFDLNGDDFESIRLRILQSVLNKIVEFVDLQAMNFFFIFCKVFAIPESAFEYLSAYFPVENMNKASSDYREWYDNGALTVIGGLTFYDARKIPVTTSDGLSSFRSVSYKDATIVDVGTTKWIQVDNPDISFTENEWIWINDIEDGWFKVIGPKDTTSGKIPVIGDAEILVGHKVGANDGLVTVTGTGETQWIQLDASVNAEANDAVTYNWMKDTFDIDGNSSFNINGLESEHYHMVANALQSLTAQRGEGSSDLLGLELELAYEEITRHQGITEWNEPTFLYYPQSFEVVKSIWDHSHITMANLVGELGNAF